MPFYLRTGKRLAKRVTEIAIQFKRAPFMLFRKAGVESLAPNLLVIRIQPDEGISLRFGAKIPGPTMQQAPVDMDFTYADYFGARAVHRLRAAALRLHDRRPDAVPARRHGRGRLEHHHSRCSTSGRRCRRARSRTTRPAPGDPKEADDLLARDGHAWRMNGE